MKYPKTVFIYENLLRSISPVLDLIVDATNVLIGIFQVFCLVKKVLLILSREWFKSALYFLKRELFVRFVIEKIETCPIDVCHESVLKQKGSEASTDSDF